eukprot:NODE_10792_length_491_cov_17.730978_g10140_i0.p1 GENE.NODE_10792_length_491_cov_17.730978_g10140_i0~~NODE_10792_length_491_cov_17.730978_g10140_i0.p1  ORF type:complete len:138 (-),score=33.63 NODE_10792_length_491_cov_17.730978_g10140_i0:78-437(-)
MSASQVLFILLLGFIPFAVCTRQASASHILVRTEDEARSLLDKLNTGADFAKLARDHSACPSGQNGGSLGTFGPGQMVKPFDDAVFSSPVGKVVGPVKTQFGYHLILVHSRFGSDDVEL